MLNFEKKSISLADSSTEVDLDKRIIQGYWSLFTPDQIGDLTQKGTFTKTIRERGPRTVEKKNADGEIVAKVESSIKMCWDHKDLIGIPIVIHEDSKGAYFEGRVSATPLGDTILTQVDDGTIDSLSFQYKVIKANYPKGDLEVKRCITEAYVREMGPVKWGCHADTKIDGRKSEESIGALVHELLELIHRGDLDDSSEVKSLYDELTERFKVAPEEAAPEIVSQPSGDLVLAQIKEFTQKLENLEKKWMS